MESDAQIRRFHLDGVADCFARSTVNFRQPGSDDISAAHVCASLPDTLIPIIITDLRLGAVSSNTILWGTIVEPSFFMSSITALIEDERGAVISVSLYNFVPGGSSLAFAQAAFPVGLRLGFKEPYMKRFASGKLGLRVDNPCNVIILPPLAIANDVDALKAFGNTHFTTKHYSMAVMAYAAALLLCADDDAQSRAVLLSNRAAAHIACCSFEDALNDCNAALQLMPEAPLAAKIVYRRVQTLMYLYRFKEALAAIEEAAKGDSSAPLTSLRKAVVVAALQARGKYDLTSLPFSPGTQDAIATYMGPLEVRVAGSKGRGLFLTRDVKDGEILLVEHAVAASYATNGVTDMAHGANGKLNTETQHDIITNLILKAAACPRFNSQLSLLSTGLMNTTKPPSIPDLSIFTSGSLETLAPCSALTVKNIVSTNTFGGAQILNEPNEACRRVLQQILLSPTPPSDGYECFIEPGNKIMFACMPSMENEHLSPRQKAKVDESRKVATLAAIKATPEAQRLDDLNFVSEGLTALTYAVMSKDVGTVKVLLDAGARVNGGDARGLTALHNATVSWWDEGVASTLLDAGADINAMSRLGTTPLGAAVGQYKIEAIKFLLRRGANPNAEDGLPGSCIEQLRQRTGLLDEHDKSPIYRAFAEVGAPLVPGKHGTMLFLIASLMNHEKHEDASTTRMFFGETMFVQARRALRKGAEITTTYKKDATHWGIPN